LSRQTVPNLKGSSIEGVYKGAYILTDSSNGKPQIILVGTGSEVSLCFEAAALLKNVNVRVVSMPCWELFKEQSNDYQLSVFPDGVPVLAVEAGSAVGWQEFAHAVVGMRSFGESGPAKDVFKKFGFTADNIANKANQVLEFYTKHPCVSKVLKPF